MSTLLRTIGDYAVQTGVNNLFQTLGNQTLADWVQTPTTNLYSSLWSGWVNYTYPQDPDIQHTAGELTHQCESLLSLYKPGRASNRAARFLRAAFGVLHGL